MPGSFRIASAYVEVSARTDKAQMRRAAERVGREAAGNYTSGFEDGTRSGMRRTAERAHQPLRGANGRFIKAGTEQGAAYAGAFASAAQHGIRVERGRFVAAGEEAGEGFSDGFTRDVNGRLRDSKGRFVKGLGEGNDWERGGRRSGGGFMGGMRRAFSGGLGGLSGMFTKSFGALGKVPWVLVAVVAAAFATLPLIGATAGALTTLAFGAGIAGIGLLAAAQSEHVQQHFSDMKDHIVSTMREIARPLEDTLIDVSDDITDLFDTLSPHLEQAFEDMAPALSRFSDDLFGAFEGDGTLIQGITDAFTALLDDLGPQLEGAFGRMGEALGDLFGTVEENPDVFAGIIVGALDFVTGLIKVVDWLSEAYVWISEKVPGGLLTLISPLGGLTTHLLDTQEAGGGLIDKFREMRDALAEAFGHISGGVSDLKDTVMPILQDIQDALADSDVMDTVSAWWTDISEIVALGGEVIGTIMRRVADVLGFIWDNFGSNIIGIFSGLWTIVSGIISGAFEVIKGLFNVFIGVFTGDWARAWEGIKQIFSGLWEAVIGLLSGYWKIITNIFGALVGAIVGAFTWLYDVIVGNSIVPDLVEAIVGWFTGLRDRGAALFAALRDWVVARVRAMRDWAVAAVINLRDRAVGFFTSLRDRGADIVGKMRDWVTTRARALRDNVVGAFDTLRDKAINAFTRAKDGIADVWKQLKEAVSSPVKFAVETVYNGGIVPLWNDIAGKLDLGKLKEIKLKGFEQGGMVDMRNGGVQPGYSARDNRLAMFRDGEGVLVPEAVRSLGSGFVNAANNLKGRASDLLTGLPGFRFGGIIGEFGNQMKGRFKDGFMNAVSAVTGPIVSAIRDEFGSSGFRGLPTRMIDHLVGKLHTFLTPFSHRFEGGNGQGVVEEARKHIGLSGRPNKFTTPYMPGSWPWCGAFAGQMFERSGAGDAISKVLWKPAVRSWTSLPSVSRDEVQPGYLALYRGDTGHINVVENPDDGTSIGGNESNSVRRQKGYMESASSYRKPAFLRGGVVGEARQFWDQDRDATGPARTPESDKVMRRVLAGMPATHDGGGVVLDKHAGVNRRGEAELMVLRDEMRQWVAAARTGGLTIENLYLQPDMSKIRSVDDIVRLVEGIEQTARQHGARVRVGAPR